MKLNDMKVCNQLIKHGKYFVPPPKDGEDFKELFRFLVSVGAGLPTDRDGVPIGSWTPEILADAISQFDTNRSGVDLRTVQHWFQDNDKGISADNIHWLARIFGCDDADATIAWRAELSAANQRLVAKRKKKRKARDGHARAEGDASQPHNGNDEAILADEAVQSITKNRFSLAKMSDAMFHARRSAELPVVIFTGAVALGLISFTLGIHSVVFAPADASAKQVGFLWAPNWTVTFLFVLPVYMALLIDLLKTWKREWRPRLVSSRGEMLAVESWGTRVAAASYSYWSVLVVTLLIASGYNWTVSYLVPLLDGDTGSLPVDWGRIAIFRPDVISIPAAIIFSGIVFFYNAVCSYLFFAGLVFLHTLTQDYTDIARAQLSEAGRSSGQRIEDKSFVLMTGIFRCTALGLFITILMKMQSSYLVSDSPNILNWLLSDIRSLFGSSDPLRSEKLEGQNAPGLYYSFFCVLAISAVYLNASVRLRSASVQLDRSDDVSQSLRHWPAMDGTMVLLVATYLLIGTMSGFSIVLFASAVVATYVIYKPAFWWRPPQAKEI